MSNINTHSKEPLFAHPRESNSIGTLDLFGTDTNVFEGIFSIIPTSSPNQIANLEWVKLSFIHDNFEHYSQSKFMFIVLIKNNEANMCYKVFPDIFFYSDGALINTRRLDLIFNFCQEYPEAPIYSTFIPVKEQLINDLKFSLNNNMVGQTSF